MRLMSAEQYAERQSRSVRAPKPVPLQPRTFGGGMAEFTVYGVPIAKGRPRFGNGHTYTPKKTVDAEVIIRDVARLNGCLCIVGAVRLEAEFYLPIPGTWSKAKKQQAMLGILRPQSREDLDNLVKTLGDGLTFDKSDAQIVELAASKHYSVEPRTVVRVIPIPGPGA